MKRARATIEARKGRVNCGSMSPRLRHPSSGASSCRPIRSSNTRGRASTSACRARHKATRAAVLSGAACCLSFMKFEPLLRDWRIADNLAKVVRIEQCKENVIRTDSPRPATKDSEACSAPLFRHPNDSPAPGARRSPFLLARLHPGLHRVRTIPRPAHGGKLAVQLPCKRISREDAPTYTVPPGTYRQPLRDVSHTLCIRGVT